MPKLSAIAGAALWVVPMLATTVACSSFDPNADDGEHEQEPGTEQQALTSGVTCAHESQPAYSGGSRIGTVDTIKIGGKRTTVKTGNAFLSLQKRATARVTPTIRAATHSISAPTIARA